jgi:hypothetical protein
MNANLDRKSRIYRSFKICNDVCDECVELEQESGFVIEVNGQIFIVKEPNSVLKKQDSMDPMLEFKVGIQSVFNEHAQSLGTK